MALRLREDLVMQRSRRKLVLRTETLRSLPDEALRDAVGGLIMRDSVIVRTSNPVVPGATVGAPPVDGGQVPT
jgi:hypothetical protein